MAIQKDIVLKNGIKTKYHKISDISYNFIEDEMLLQIEHFVSRKVRENIVRLDELNESIAKLTEQMMKAVEEDDIALVNSLNEKIAMKANKKAELDDKNYVAGKMSMSIIKIPKDISMSNIYEMLMKTEIFAKSKKV